MVSTVFKMLPSADRPMLIGVLVDVSGSMMSSLTGAYGQTQTRLESFRTSFSDLVTQAQGKSQQGITGAVAPLVKIFAYGFGFGNPLASFMGDTGPKVRDLLQLDTENSSTVPIDRLSKEWSRYQKNLEQLVVKMFGNTPMAEGFQIVRERFQYELNNGKYTPPPILFVLSDGEPTDSTPAEVAQIANIMKSEGVLIISCYVTDQDVVEPRRLYNNALPDWSQGASLMFDCASVLPKNSPFQLYFSEFGWKADPEAKLFTQINQSEILSEFLNVVISPLGKEQEHPVLQPTTPEVSKTEAQTDKRDTSEKTKLILPSSKNDISNEPNNLSEQERTNVVTESQSITAKRTQNSVSDEFVNLIGRYGERYSTAIIYTGFTLVSLLVASILFGILKSTGVMKLVFAGSVQEAEFGGAFAGFLITLILLIRSYNNVSTDAKIVLTGNVLSSTGVPIEGATVFVIGVDRQKKTDNTGWFQIEVNEQKSWHVKASYENKVAETNVARSDARSPITILIK